VICKLGNDSQKAVQVLEKMSGSEVDFVTVKDICGGLMAWAQKIDPSFPQY
jgi:adenylyltransferase/sulfurtransferase